MAEAVRRRYTRLLRESEAAGSSRAAAAGEEDKEAGRPIAEELRKLMQHPAGAFAILREEAAAHSQNQPKGSHLPDLIVIDGGKGQLKAAREELEKLGLGSIPVIGLAKEFEEIHRPGQEEALRLGQDHHALKLLQRIRDESHRVANSYNAQLRLRKISESVLDEFPGIGEARKAALLKKFGSVQRLRLAEVEEIAAVPGFGGKAATELKTFLAARSQPPAGGK
jgi:excinuclease ABC subunit C